MSIRERPIRIGIAGITGRMGSATADAAQRDGRVELIGGLTSTSSADELEWLLGSIDCLIDLTLPSASGGLALASAVAGVPLLCGVTGLNDDDVEALRVAGERIPVLWSRNLSQGISAIAALLRQLSESLAGFDIEIVEMHHRGKRDAPSGTALILAEAVGGQDQILTFGRHGDAPRRSGEVGVHSLRAGGLTGEHTVLFASDDEEIRISHRALNRGAFARGAVNAAVGLVSAEKGLRIV